MKKKKKKIGNGGGIDKMCKFTPKNDGRFIDPCMIRRVKELKDKGIRTLGCCCGHKKYDTTIIVKLSNGEIWEHVHGVKIPRKKRFYKKDKQGYYYIPETLENFGLGK